MQKSRLTYKGAIHHIMNRGVLGQNVLATNSLKILFINIMIEEAKRLKMNIIAYCIMDNHYHIILENSSEKMGKFMQNVNSKYAIYYRKIYGGKGYVFQNRYKSILVDKDKYLRMLILYVLLNPVRKEIVNSPFLYKFSSIKEYFNKNQKKIIYVKIVEEIFKNKNKFEKSLIEWAFVKEIYSKKTRIGYIMGDKKFLEKSIKLFNRRKNINKNAPKMRIEDKKLLTKKQIISNFESKYKIKINKIDWRLRNNKKIRNELLYLLREKGDISYKEINKLRPFRNLKFSYLSRLLNKIKCNNEDPEVEKNSNV